MLRMAFILVMCVGIVIPSGCAAIPGAAALPAPPAGTPAVPAGAPGTTNVVVPGTLDINVHRSRGSIWDFLGIPEIRRAFRGLAGGIYQLGARLFPAQATSNPQQEPGAPILPVNSPANLNSSSPAVQSAAKIKQDEDQKQQKIKAINYLATIGCGGCYPDVQAAFLAALDDCTEEVRYAAVVGLKNAAGNSCKYCTYKSCCSLKIRAKLLEMSSEGACFDCPGEPSARVRRMARIALENCGGKGLNAVPELLPSDIEGPTLAIPPAAAATTASPAQQAQLAQSEAPVSESTTLVASNAKPQPQNMPELSPDQLEQLAAGWLAEMDVSLSLDEKRDLMRQKLRHYLRTQQERDILLGDVMHELQVQTGQSTSVATNQHFVMLPKKVVDDEMQSGTLIETGTPPQSIQQVGLTQAAVPNPAAKNSDDTSQPVGPLVRWESLTWTSPTGGVAASHSASLQQMQKLRAFLSQSPGANPPTAAFKQQLQFKTNDWTATSQITHPHRRAQLESLEVGGISPVIQTDDGWELVRLLQRIDGPTCSDQPTDPAR